MSARELIVLGTSSQVPSRYRNHNAYLLRFDKLGLLFDPGEGTQRQMVFAGVSASKITRILLSHFHGDHCLGLPGIIQRLSLDGVTDPISVHFPKSGEAYFNRLRKASIFMDKTDIQPAPVSQDGVIYEDDDVLITAARLDHTVPCYGYRFEEKPRFRVDNAKARAMGLTGPQIGALVRDEPVSLEGRAVARSDIGALVPGQVFTYLLDSRPCDAARMLAKDADMVLMDSTYLEAEAHLAAEYGHSTVVESVKLAAEVGARRVVLTHFSQRYRTLDAFLEEASAHHPDVVIARDCERISMPSPRR